MHLLFGSILAFWSRGVESVILSDVMCQIVDGGRGLRHSDHYRQQQQFGVLLMKVTTAFRGIMGKLLKRTQLLYSLDCLLHVVA